MKKSGKASCCARGGSWFGKCGGVGNANLGHTWYEGIQVCKGQFQAAVGQQMHDVQPKGNISSNNGSIDIDSKVITAAAQRFTFTSANTSTPMRGTTLITVPETTLLMQAARKSITYYAGQTIVKTTTAASTTITQTSVNVSTPNPTIFSPNMTIVKLMHNPSAQMSMTTSSHASDGAKTPSGGCQKLLGAVTHIMILTVMCMC